MENRFDLYELPEGHQERFEARLAGQQSRQWKHTQILRWTALAAGLALVLWLGTGAASPLRRAHTPEGVYAAYLHEVGGLYEQMAAQARGNDDWVRILDEITGENIPLYEQLPDELSRREKTLLLKRHYGSILAEARQLKSLNKQ